MPFLNIAVSAILLFWNAHNRGVIERMGMAWDTGPPLWPYQFPDKLLIGLNIPALVVCQLLTAPLHIYGIGRDLVFAACIVAQWAIVDRWLKSRGSSGKPYSHRIASAIFFLVVAASTVGLMLNVLITAARWAFEYLANWPDVIRVFPEIGVIVWGIVLSTTMSIAAYRRLRYRAHSA